MISNNKVHRGKPIAIQGFHSPVDIIIPYHGQYQKVTRLLESIFRFTRTSPYQICLVDDCSPNTDYQAHWLSQIKNLKLVRTEKRLGFGGAMREGFLKTTNPYCVFINSDCVVEDIGWLQNLGQSLLNLKSQGVRMVAPQTNNAVNGCPQQQITKEAFNQANMMIEDGDEEKKDIVLDLYKDKENPEFLSMYCFMCHRDLFKKCNGFIKSYPFGWYEDMEFAFRMKKHGYKQAVCTSSWIYHEGECTVKELWRRDVKSRQIMSETNADQCNADIQKLYQK